MRHYIEAVDRAGGTPGERARGAQRIQGWNDVVVFASSGIASVTSASALESLGWRGMQAVGWGSGVAIVVAVAAAVIADPAAPAPQKPPPPPPPPPHQDGNDLAASAAVEGRGGGGGGGSNAV